MPSDIPSDVADRLCRICAKVISEQQTKIRTMQTFWVVERFENGKSAGYWDGGSSRSFTRDIDKAVQFRRRQDGFWVTHGWHWGDTQITEHAMVNAFERASHCVWPACSTTGTPDGKCNRRCPDVGGSP